MKKSTKTQDLSRLRPFVYVSRFVRFRAPALRLQDNHGRCMDTMTKNTRRMKEAKERLRKANGSVKAEKALPAILFFVAAGTLCIFLYGAWHVGDGNDIGLHGGSSATNRTIDQDAGGGTVVYVANPRTNNPDIKWTSVTPASPEIQLFNRQGGYDVFDSEMQKHFTIRVRGTNIFITTTNEVSCDQFWGPDDKYEIKFWSKEEAK